MGSWFRTVAVASACMLALSACGGDPDPVDATPTTSPPSSSPSPSASASATPASTPAPSASTSPTAAPDWSALDCPPYDDGYDPTYVAVEPHRYASICLGMSFAEASATIPGPPLQSDAQCPWYADIVVADPLFVAAITDRDDPGESIQLLRASYLDDPAAAPPLEMPATAEGITIGSTTADVLTAYPGASEISVEDPARGVREQIVAPQSAGLAYVFDITSGVVSEMTWGAGLEDGIAGEYCAG